MTMNLMRKLLGSLAFIGAVYILCWFVGVLPLDFVLGWATVFFGFALGLSVVIMRQNWVSYDPERLEALEDKWWFEGPRLAHLPTEIDWREFEREVLKQMVAVEESGGDIYQIHSDHILYYLDRDMRVPTHAATRVQAGNPPQGDRVGPQGTTGPKGPNGSTSDHRLGVAIDIGRTAMDVELHVDQQLHAIRSMAVGLFQIPPPNVGPSYLDSHLPRSRPQRGPRRRLICTKCGEPMGTDISRPGDLHPRCGGGEMRFLSDEDAAPLLMLYRDSLPEQLKEGFDRFEDQRGRPHSA